MEVTRFNFKEARDDFLCHLDSAAFISFDLEMTGIRSEHRNVSDLPYENYLKAFNAANRYSVIQFGLCIFKHKNKSTGLDNEDHAFLKPSSEFEAFPYTFYMFPRTYDGMMKKDIIMEVSSIEYNVFKHDIDWNKWLDNGVGYSDAEERKFLKKFISKDKSK